MAGYSSVKTDASMLFDALEYSLVSLRKGINDLYTGDEAEVRRLSLLLRDLTCKSAGLEGLLWRAKSIFPFDDLINVPDFKKEFLRSPENEKSAVFVPLMEHGSWQLRGIALRKQSLQKYLENGTAIRYRKRDSNEIVEMKPVAVIKAIANKIGAHTAEEVSETFALLAAMKSGGSSVLVRLIGSYSILVADIGERALDAAHLKGFNRRKNSPTLPTTSLAHLKINYDLKVPEADMGDINFIRLPLSHGTAEEARREKPPFQIGQAGIAGILIDVYVGINVDIEVYVSGLSSSLNKFVFKYPSAEKSLSNLDISWNKEIIRAQFEGVTHEVFR